MYTYIYIYTYISRRHGNDDAGWRIPMAKLQNNYRTIRFA